MKVIHLLYWDAKRKKWGNGLREKAKVDRIACPWLIKHIVDKDAKFLFAPKDKLQEIARREGSIPFDAPGVELTHYEDNGKERVSFDAIIIVRNTI